MTLESMLEAYEETYGHKITGPGKVKIPAAYARNRFIEAAYAQGHTIKDISKLLKIDYTNVYRLLKKPIKTPPGFIFTKPAEFVRNASVPLRPADG